MDYSWHALPCQIQVKTFYPTEKDLAKLAFKKKKIPDIYPPN